jgi:hypothetical protein
MGAVRPNLGRQVVFWLAMCAQLGDAFSPAMFQVTGLSSNNRQGFSRPDHDLARRRTLDPITIDLTTRLFVLFSLWLVRGYSILMAALLAGEALLLPNGLRCMASTCMTQSLLVAVSLHNSGNS